MTRKVGSILFALSLVALLGACQSIKDLSDAMEGKTDENEMLAAQPAKGPTLSLPPDYNLRPPVAGAGASSDPRAASQAARQKTFAAAGVPAAASSGPAPANQSPGEAAFAKQVASSAGSPTTTNIRQTVDSETSNTSERERVLVEKLLTWQDGSQVTPTGNGSTVTQTPVTDSPVVIQQKRGVLDLLF